MPIPVTQIKKNNQFFLITTDEFKDELAGPYATEDEVISGAIELDLDIIMDPIIITATVNGRVPKSCQMVGSLPIDTLFRIDSGWYRIKLSGKKCQVEVVGEKREIEMKGNTPISAVSVLNLA